MVMEEYIYDDEDDYEDDTDREPVNPKWRTLSPKERRELMKNVFANSEWYEGIPVFDGGDANPMFTEIAEKAEAPVREVRRYYAAWLKSQGFSPSDALKPVDDTLGLGSSSIAATTPTSVSSPFDSTSTAGFSSPPPPIAPPSGAGQSDMGNLMTFLIHQQNIQMQQQHFQLQMMMEQRRLDQGRETEQRRETMARDQQNSNQQMAFMREMMKKGGDDGFFDSDMKGMFKERMVDSMFGDKDESWKESIKDVIGSDTMKAAVGGLGTALSSARTKIPAGYDQPDYNPYAQTPPQLGPTVAAPQPIPAPIPTPIPPSTQPGPVVAPPGPYPGELDGVFFDEEQGEVQRPMQVLPAEPEPEQQIVQFNDDEYKKILFAAFTEAMGPVANDPQVLSALQEQIDVAVATTVIEIPEMLPQMKLQKMNEKLLLIRNLRDIGMGMMDLRERTPSGEAPSDLMVGAGVADLRTNPEFYNIFAENTYDELMAKIEPFKNTGAVEQDYLYLQRPEVQEVCRHLLQAVKNDAMQNGMPQVPSLT